MCADFSIDRIISSHEGNEAASCLTRHCTPASLQQSAARILITGLSERPVTRERMDGSGTEFWKKEAVGQL